MSRAATPTGDVHVAIGELVVEGLAVRNRHAFGAAVSVALTRLVTEGGRPVAHGGSPAPITLTHDPGAGDGALAESVARAIWSVLAPHDPTGASAR